MGYRFHPENLSYYLNPLPPKTFRKIELTNGKSLVGEVAREWEGGVVLKSAGGVITFNKKEIVAIQPITEKQAIAERLTGLNPESHKKPIFTFRPEDSLFYDLSEKELRNKKAKEYDEEESKEESNHYRERIETDEVNPATLNPAEAISMALNAKGMAEARQREFAEYTRLLEGEGYSDAAYDGASEDEDTYQSQLF